MNLVAWETKDELVVRIAILNELVVWIAILNELVLDLYTKNINWPITIS